MSGGWLCHIYSRILVAVESVEDQYISSLQPLNREICSLGDHLKITNGRISYIALTLLVCMCPKVLLFTNH